MLKFKSIFNSSFVRHVSVLAGGTAFAQALALMALPLLTRIYTPEEFGVLAVFAALLGMISVNSALRYQIAIPLPESERSAANLLALSLVCVAVVTGLTAVATYLFSPQIASLMHAPALVNYLWLLPTGVFVTGAYSVFQYWATRKKAFARIARTYVEQSLGGVSTQLLMGWAGMGAVGLIVGQLVNNGAGLLGLAGRTIKEDRETLKSIRTAEMRTVAREYDRFPKYSTLEALTNTASLQLPIILIASLVVGAEVGYLMLAMRVMQAPMSLVGTSISQVYFSRAVVEHRDGALSDFTVRTIAGLAKVGVGPLIFAGIVAPSIFGLLFGANWQRAGELVAWMTPWFVVQFLASPVSMVMHVTNSQRSALLLQIFGLLMRVMSVLAVSFAYGAYVLEAYAISGFLFYLTYLVVVGRVANISLAQAIKVIWTAAIYAVGWIGAAIVVWWLI